MPLMAPQPAAVATVKRAATVAATTRREVRVMRRTYDTWVDPSRVGAPVDQLVHPGGTGDDDALDEVAAEDAVLDDAGDGVERDVEGEGIGDRAEVRVHQQVPAVAAAVAGGQVG